MPFLELLGSDIFQFGLPEEWLAFQTLHGKDVSASMEKANETCFELLQSSQERMDGEQSVVLVFLAASCLKEYSEICLLAGNGFGSGATKLLRSLYERVVTLGYLAKYTSKVRQFVDFSHIQWYRLLKDAEEIKCDDAIPPEKKEYINKKYEELREQFTTNNRVRFSWVAKSLAQQAKEVSDSLRARCFDAYLRPTFYLHTTYWAIERQLEKTPQGKFSFLATKLEREAAGQAVDCAHFLLLHVMDVLNDHFKLERDDAIETALKDWERYWNSETEGPSPNTNEA